MLPAYEEDINEWIGVPSDVIPEYSSLICMQVRGYPSTNAANTCFIMHSNYQTL
jgi:hypothetical protein